jgi:hypothetical protein
VIENSRSGNPPDGNLPNDNLPNGNLPNGNLPKGNLPNGNLPRVKSRNWISVECNDIGDDRDPAVKGNNR